MAPKLVKWGLPGRGSNLLIAKVRPTPCPTVLYLGPPGGVRAAEDFSGTRKMSPKTPTLNLPSHCQINLRGTFTTQHMCMCMCMSTCRMLVYRIKSSCSAITEAGASVNAGDEHTVHRTRPHHRIPQVKGARPDRKALRKHACCPCSHFSSAPHSSHAVPAAAAAAGHRA